MVFKNDPTFKYRYRLLTTRFTNETYEELERFKENNNLIGKSLFNIPIKLRFTNVSYEYPMIVLEMNNSENDLDSDDDGVSDNQLYQLRTSGNILVFPDAGENNGIWDYGEDYFDLNDNKEFDRGREPEEISFYLNNTIEVPWMVINAGARVDIVNYNTRMWSDPNGNISPYTPYFYLDADNDGDDSASRYNSSSGSTTGGPLSLLLPPPVSLSPRRCSTLRVSR